MKKLAMVLAAMLFAGVVFPAAAQAQRAFFVVQAHAAGMSIGGALMLQLTDTNGAFTNKWFTTIDATKKEMLATALTGIATGQNLWIAVDPNAGGFPVIDTVFLRE